MSTIMSGLAAMARRRAGTASCCHRAAGRRCDRGRWKSSDHRPSAASFEGKAVGSGEGLPISCRGQSTIWNAPSPGRFLATSSTSAIASAKSSCVAKPVSTTNEMRGRKRDADQGRRATRRCWRVTVGGRVVSPSSAIGEDHHHHGKPGRGGTGTNQLLVRPRPAASVARRTIRTGRRRRRSPCCDVSGRRCGAGRSTTRRCWPPRRPAHRGRLRPGPAALHAGTAAWASTFFTPGKAALSTRPASPALASSGTVWIVPQCRQRHTPPAKASSTSNVWPQLPHRNRIMSVQQGITAPRKTANYSTASTGSTRRAKASVSGPLIPGRESSSAHPRFHAPGG